MTDLPCLRMQFCDFAYIKNLPDNKNLDQVRKINMCKTDL